MELSQQICSLNLAKRLRELGVKQESFLYWWQDGVEAHSDREPSYYVNDGEINPPDIKLASAFTVAELLEGMPGHIDLEDGTRSFLVLDKYMTDTTGTNYSCGYHPKNGRGFNAGFCDEKNFVEAVGLMKAYLIEHKLI